MRLTNSPLFWWEQHKGEKHTLREWLSLVPSTPFPYHTSSTPALNLGRRKKERGGRPTKYSRDLAIEFCCRWAKMRSLTAAAAFYRIHRTTIWRWRRQHLDFADMYIITRGIVQLLRKSFPLSCRKSRMYKTQVMHQENGVFSASKKHSYFRGRPSLYRPEYNENVAPTWTETAMALGVSRRTIANWSRRYPDFRARVQFNWAVRQIPRMQKSLEKLQKRAKAKDHS